MKYILLSSLILLSVLGVAAEKPKASAPKKDVLSDICDVLLGKSSDIAGFDRQSYRFVFTDGGEFEINLGWFMPSNGSSPLSYVEVFDWKEEKNPRNPEPVTKIKMIKTIVAKDRRSILLTSLGKSPFSVKFELNAPFENRKLDIKSVLIIADGEVRPLGLDLLTSETKKKYVKFEGKDADDIMSILPWDEMKKAEEANFQNLPLNQKQWRTQLELSSKSTGFEYRGLTVVIGRRSNSAVVAGLSSASLTHLKNGLKGLGLRADHPIFSL